MLKNILYFLWALSIPNIALGQSHSRKIKVDGDYIHSATKTVFPISIDDYNRIGINAFDKLETNVAGTYEKSNLNGKTILTIYLYPAGNASGVRFRNEYLDCLYSVSSAAGKDVTAEQQYIFYKKDGYKINGFQASFITANKTKTVLQLYECGVWFLKTRITSDILDTLGIDSLNKKVVEIFAPVNLVKYSDLELRSEVKISEETMGDSLFLGCTMSSAFKEMEWAEANIDSLELASGFPGLYLDMHIEALKDFVKFADDHKDWPSNNFTKNYLDQLKLLIANDYLDEFIMKQYSYIAIVPENKTFDFKSFDEWRITHTININLNNRYYSIEYEPKK